MGFLKEGKHIDIFFYNLPSIKIISVPLRSKTTNSTRYNGETELCEHSGLG